MGIDSGDDHAIMCSVVFATNPFNFGNQIKACSQAEQTFLVQLTNGWPVWLPTAKAEKGGHYSAFVSGGYVGPVGGEMLLNQTLNDIAKLFE